MPPATRPARQLTTTFVFALLAAACGPEVPKPAATTIGPEGGTVELTGAKLTIPAGALGQPTAIGIRQTETPPPSGMTAQSPLFEFAPPGLQFAVPATVTLAFTGAPSGLAVYWSKADGSGFESLGGTIDGSSMTAPVTHFSAGFVGATAGGNGPPTGQMGGTIQSGPLSLTGAVTVLVDAAVLPPRGITTDGTNLYLAAMPAVLKVVIATGEATILAGDSMREGTTDATGTEARFGETKQITTDGVHLFVTDGDRIRKIVIATAAVTTLTTGAVALGITTDNTSLYFSTASTVPAKVFEVDPASGEKTALGESGSSGLTTDGASLFILHYHGVRRMALAGGAPAELAGGDVPCRSTDATGPAAKFCAPLAITSDGTNLYVGEGPNVRKVVIATGEVTTLFALEGSIKGLTTDGTSLYATVGRRVLRID